MSEPIRVMVVDDSPSTRSMLREALSLEGTMEVVAEAGTGREAVIHAGLSDPDVVLMDVRMPEGDGVKAARTILAESPATKIGRPRQIYVGPTKRPYVPVDERG